MFIDYFCFYFLFLLTIDNRYLEKIIIKRKVKERKIYYRQIVIIVVVVLLNLVERQIF